MRALTPEINPATGKMMIAVYVGGVHCGYAPHYVAADALAREIEAARAAAEEE